MAEAANNPTPEALDAAGASKLVKRQAPVLDKKTGKPTGETTEKPLTEKEVFAFAVREDGTVVVVTVDGQKLFGKVE